MNNEFYKQRRNLIVICCVIILINLTGTKIEDLFPILSKIEIKKLNFLFINNYSNLLLWIFAFIFLRFFSYVKEYEREISNKITSGRYFAYTKIGKFFNVYIILLDKLFSKSIYDIFVPMYLSSIIIFSTVFNAFSGFEDARIATLMGAFFLTIIFLLIIGLELKDFFLLKKNFRYIRRNKRIDYYRDIYNKKKEKLYNKKSC